MGPFSSKRSRQKAIGRDIFPVNDRVKRQFDAIFDRKRRVAERRAKEPCAKELSDVYYLVHNEHMQEPKKPTPFKQDQIKSRSEWKKYEKDMYIFKNKMGSVKCIIAGIKKSMEIFESKNVLEGHCLSYHSIIHSAYMNYESGHKNEFYRKILEPIYNYYLSKYHFKVVLDRGCCEKHHKMNLPLLITHTNEIKEGAENGGCYGRVKYSSEEFQKLPSSDREIIIRHKAICNGLSLHFRLVDDMPPAYKNSQASTSSTSKTSVRATPSAPPSATFSLGKQSEPSAPPSATSSLGEQSEPSAPPPYEKMVTTHLL